MALCGCGPAGREAAGEGEGTEAPTYLAVETPPAPTLTPEQALAAFALAPGYAIEAVATEPLVEDPVAIAWDEHGSLYVAEMRAFMPDTYGKGQKAPIGEVVRLLDTDGDTVYDRRELLLAGLVLPRALAVVNEGLLVGEPPNLWLCPNTDGSARTIDCGKKRRLGEYGNQPGSVEHAENGLLMGLDNWLYSAKSARRLRLRDGVLEEEPTLFRGQWGISKDNHGRLYYNTNSSLLLGDSYDAQQVVKAGNRGGPGLGALISRDQQLHAVRVNTGVNRAYVPGVLREDGRLNLPTSASGMDIYRGDQLGPGHEEHVFVAEPAANVVAQLRLVRRGLEVTAEHLLYPDPKWGQREFLASTDERFRPVDVKTGPDGALYVVDLYRGVIQDHVYISEELRQQAKERGLDRPLGLGRIWRITKADQPKRGLAPGLETYEQRLAALGHANGWHRDTAQRLLIAEESPTVDDDLRALIEPPTGSAAGDLPQAAAGAALASPTPRSLTSRRHWGSDRALAAIHALWTLQGRGALTRDQVLQTLQGPEDARGKQAALEAGVSLLTADDLLAPITPPAPAAYQKAGSSPLAAPKAVGGPSTPAPTPTFTQHLTLALAPHNAREDVQAQLLATLLANADDPYRRMAVQAASHLQEVAILKRLLAGGGWNAEREAQTSFVKSLASQGLRSQPDTAKAWLDYIAGDMPAWARAPALDGIFEVSRDPSFQRIALPGPHPLFATDGLSAEQQALWPAIARARRSFTWQGDTLLAGAKPLTPQQEAARQLGEAYYASHCAACHGADGQGLASLGPALVDSPRVTGPSEPLALILLNGVQGAIGVMPGHAAVPEFTDEVAAGLVTYLYRAWGHGGRAVAPAFMAAMRAAHAERSQPWTAADLDGQPINTHYRKYEGDYGGGGLPLAFTYNGRALEVGSGIFNGPLVETQEDRFLFEPRGLQLEFVLADDGRVTGVRMATDEGGVLLPRVVAE